MKRTVIALIAGVLAAGAGAGTAAADSSQPPAGPAPQTVAQLAGSSQQAQASATSTQIKPENTNVSVRVLSPGDTGSVSQANSSTAAALAANVNPLDQSASQTAGGGYPAAPVQSVGQVAASKQDADAWADSTQVKPKNTNVSVRVLSPGDDGDVTQENKSTALGLALNKNDTTQTATQEAGGGSPVQAAEQVAKSEQYADASAESKQIEPKNTNVSVRVLSRGDNGSVSQENSSKAIGVGANLNRTEQTATQTGGTDGLSKQTAGQVALSKQDADAWADSKQVKPKNTNVSVRVLSPGDDGDVSQENKSTALGIAANKNDTDQTVTQDQGGRYGDVAVQAAGQIASNYQDAWASAESKQIEPENSNLSVGTLSHDDGGAVSQRNSSTALAASLNINKLTQTAAQSQGGGTGASPEAAKKPEPEEKEEDALGLRVPEEDDDSVSQLNKSFAAAISANLNQTTQTATQSQDGKGDVAVQAAGQVAANKQKADSDADSFQLGARNENGGLSAPDHCKHDFCEPDRKHDPCKLDARECKPHDWDPNKCKPDHEKRYGCKHDPRDDKCKPDHEKPYGCKHDPRDDKCKPRDCKPDRGMWDHGMWDGKRDECKPERGTWDDCKPDHGKPDDCKDRWKSKRCDPCEHRKPCQYERRSVPLEPR